MPDWKGFFADPEVQKLSPQEFSAAYESMAAADPEMEGFSDQDHNDFIRSMQSANVPPEPPKTEQQVTWETGTAEGAAMVPGWAEGKGDIPIARAALSSFVERIAPTINSLVAGKQATDVDVVGAQGAAGQMLLAPELAQTVPVAPLPGAPTGDILEGLIRMIPEPLRQQLGQYVSGWAQEQLPQEQAQYEQATKEAVQSRARWKQVAKEVFGDRPDRTFKEALGATREGTISALPEYAWEAISEALVTSGPSALAGRIPFVGPLAATLGLFYLTQGEQAEQLYQAGVKETPGLTQGIIPTALEHVGMRKIFGKLPTRLAAEKGGVLGVLAGRAQNVTESAFTEGLTELGQSAYNIYLVREKQGIPFTDPLTEAEKTDLTESFMGGFLGGGGISIVGSMRPTPQEIEVAVERETKKWERLTKEITDAEGKKTRVAKTPEELAAEGIIIPHGPQYVPIEDARIVALDEAPKKLVENMTDDQMTRFIQGTRNEQGAIFTTDELSELSAASGMSTESINEALNAAEIKAVDLSTIERKVAEPTAEGQSAEAEVSNMFEIQAQLASARGDNALAEARRQAAGQVTIVEPTTLVERGLKAVIETSGRVGAKPKVVFFTVPEGQTNIRVNGVLVGKGVVAVNVSPGYNQTAHAIVGHTIHELIHNLKQVSPVAYRSLVSAMKGNETLWQSAVERYTNTVPKGEQERHVREGIQEEEIMSNIGQLDNMAANFLIALQEYATVEKMAKDPTGIKALAERFLTTVGGMIKRLASSPKGRNLKGMGRLSSLRLNPKEVRDVAKATKALVDALASPIETAPVSEAQETAPTEPQAAQAPERLLAADITETPTVIPYEKGSFEVNRENKGYRVRRKLPSGKVIASKFFANLREVKAFIKTQGGPKYSVTMPEFRKIVGPTSPQGLLSIGAEQAAFGVEAETAIPAAILIGSLEGKTPDQIARLAGKMAFDAIKNIRVVERKEFTNDEKALYDFASKIGIHLVFYEGASKMLAGVSGAPGTIALNRTAFLHGRLPMSEIFIHEAMHDFRKRNPAEWAVLRDAIISRMSRAWEQKRNEIAGIPLYQGMSDEQIDDEVMARVAQEHETEVWNAIVEQGRTKTGAKAFRAFARWLGGLIKKGYTTLFGKALNDEFGATILVDSKTGSYELGSMIASALAGETTPQGGSFTAFNETFRDKIELSTAHEMARMAQNPVSKDFGGTRLMEMVQAKPAQAQAATRFSVSVAGYPETLKDGWDIARWRARFAKLALHGEPGKMWYEESAQAIFELAQGDMEAATKFAKILAAYSPRSPVQVNWQQALLAWHRFKTGMSEEAFLGTQIGALEGSHENAAGILYHDAPWKGEKTNSFFNNLITMLHDKIPETVTIDMWMMRLFGFPGDAPTPKQYEMMSKEIKKLATKLGIKPWQAQAQLWVWTKSTWESMEDEVNEEAEKRGMVTHVPILNKNGEPRVDKTGKVMTTTTPEYDALYREMFQAEVRRTTKSGEARFKLKDSAVLNFHGAMMRRVGFVSSEFIPGDGTLPWLSNEEFLTKLDAHLRIEDTLFDEQSKRNIIAEELGFGTVGPLEAMLLGSSVWINTGGEVEFNPARQMPIPAATGEGGEDSRQLDVAAVKHIEVYLAMYGKAYHQNAAAMVRFFKAKGAEDNQAVEIRTGEVLTLDQLRDIYPQVLAVMKSIGGTQDDIAYYPTNRGGAFVLLNDKLSKTEFQAGVKKIKFTNKTLGTIKSRGTLGAQTVYVDRSRYDDIIREAGLQDTYRRVEARVSPRRDHVYDQLEREHSARVGAGRASVTVSGRAESTVGRYAPFWHLSVEDVTEEGIRREYAGTGATGAEAKRFRYVDGKLDPESAVIHLYTKNARFEQGVATRAKFLNKILTNFKLMPVDDPRLGPMRNAAQLETGDFAGDRVIASIMAQLKAQGFDGLVDEESGRVQINRDIDPSEISEGHELTTDERKAIRGALNLEEADPDAQFAQLKLNHIPETPSEMEKIATMIEDDGTAFFPRGTDPLLVGQYFGEVKSTSVGISARQPVRAKFSVTTTERGEMPRGTVEVRDDYEYGVRYSRGSGQSWTLPQLDPWGWIVKKVADSFIQFKYLNDVIADNNLILTDKVNVRLAEELFHGKTQEQAQRVYDRYVNPMLKELAKIADKHGVAYSHMLARFDEYLHAAHAKERNKHLREAYHDRKLEYYLKLKNKLDDKILIKQQELAQAEGPLHKTSIELALKFYQMQMLKIEKRIDQVRNQPEIHCGMTDDQADVVMKRTRTEGLIEDFGRVANSYVYPMLQDRIELLHREGLIDNETLRGISIYKHYVPLKGKGAEGDIEDMLDEFYDFGGGHGFDIRGEELPFATGRTGTDNVNPILAQSVADTLRATDRVERNRVALALLELAEANPNEELWEINQRVMKRIYDKRTGQIKDVEDWWARNQLNVVAAKRGGKTYYVTLHDAGLAMAMRGLGVENLGAVIRGIRTVMRTIAKLYTTFSPEFVLTNFTRDWQQALVSATTDMSAEAARKVAKSAPKAAAGILAVNYPNRFGYLRNEYSKAYEELKEEGGKIGFFGMMGVDKLHERILHEVTAQGKGWNFWRTMRGLHWVGEQVGAWNEAAENGLRLATYVEARRQGLSKDKAASLAKNVTVNFNRRGDVAGSVGAAYLFFNASVQGVDRFFKSMQTRAGQRLAAYYIGLGFLTSLASRAIMGDDDDDRSNYDKISEFEHGRHWILGYSSDKYIKIPMPYGFGIWAQLGKELERTLFGDEDLDKAAMRSAVRMVSGLTTHFSPIGETNFSGSFYAMTRPIIPTLAEPWTDILANETYWGSPIYPRKSPWDERSKSARHYRPETWLGDKFIRFTEGLNRMFGGSEYRSSGVLTDLNAGALTYVLESYLGPTGTTIARPFKLADKLARGEDTAWNDWVVLRRFVGENMPKYYIPGQFYDAIHDVRAAKEEERWMRDNDSSGADVARWRQRHGWKVPLDKAARDAEERIRKLRKSGASEDEILRVQQQFVSRYLRAEKR